MNRRRQNLIDKGMIPNKGGVFIDSYNQSINEEIAGTITTRVDASNMSFVTKPKIIERDTPMTTDSGVEVIQVGNIVDDTNIGFKNPQRGRIYSSDGLSPCLCDGSGGGGREPKIIERDTPMKGNYTEPRICTMEKDNLVAEPNEGTAKTLCLNSKVDGKQPSLEHRIYDAEGVSTAMTTGFLPSRKESTSYRIRKLTPRECFRLMGVTEADIDKIQQSGVSQSQQYKMAGNSIVVDCLYHMFRKMFTETAFESQQLSLF